MVKAGSHWRTVDGKVFTVIDIVDGYVHYERNGQVYSCYPEAFQQRFYPVAKRRIGKILVTKNT